MNMSNLCWPFISMMYAVTLDFSPSFTYFFMAGVTAIVLVNTLYVFRYLTAGKGENVNAISESYKPKLDNL